MFFKRKQSLTDYMESFYQQKEEVCGHQNDKNKMLIKDSYILFTFKRQKHWHT